MSPCSPSSFRSPLGKAKGLGASRSGVHPWWIQRVTAVCLIPLTVWFVGWMLPLWVQPDPNALQTAFKGFGGVVATLLWNGCAFYHGALGLQVIVEDYVPCEHGKMVGSLLIKALSIGLMIAGNVAVLKLFLTSGG